MPVKRIAAIIQFSVLTVLFAVPSLGYALEDIENVTPERATELGMIVRAKAAGPDLVSVELEFPTKGDLENHSRVALEIRAGGKLLLSSTLREEPSQLGHVVVSFAADRTRLNEFTLKVVTQESPRSRTGHVLSMKDFVDLTKLR